jgi:hypothetical protein
MHILFRFFWHKQWHGIHVFHFLNILKSFDRCDIYIEYIQVLSYCNCNLVATLTLDLQPRTCKGAGQEGSLGVTFHAPKNVGKCEGMNSHTPKLVTTLGVGVPMDFRIFIEQL